MTSSLIDRLDAGSGPDRANTGELPARGTAMVDPALIPHNVCVVFLMTLARHGIPPDVAELLIAGDGRGTIAPGALPKAIAAALNAWQTEKYKAIVGSAIDEIGTTYPAIILPLGESNE